MSHFSVLVISDDEDIEGILAPYDENITVEPYIRATKQELIEKQRKKIQDYYTDVYSEFIQNPELYKEKYKDNPEHLEYIEFKFPKELEYTDEELYIEATKFMETEELTEDGDYISTYNPKSKWDWYMIGGRWGGSLKLKGANEFVDSGYIQSLDLSKDFKSAEYYKEVWDKVVRGIEVKELTENDTVFINRFYNKEKLLKEYKTKNKFVAVNSQFQTYAVVTPDGEWHEAGEMGWFGCSFAAEEEKEQWKKDYYKYIKFAMKSNYYVTMVDCHI